jgi:helix-turn-helix protein
MPVYENNGQYVRKNDTLLPRSTTARRHRAKGAGVILRDRKKLARLAIVQGATQRDLAAAAGWTTHSYVGRLLRGEAVGVAPEPAARLAAYLGVRVDDLFDP